MGLFVLLLRFQIWKLEMFWNKNGIYLLGGEYGHIQLVKNNKKLATIQVPRRQKYQEIRMWVKVKWCRHSRAASVQLQAGPREPVSTDWINLFSICAAPGYGYLLEVSWSLKEEWLRSVSMPGENILCRAAQVSIPTVHTLALRGWPKAVKG